MVVDSSNGGTVSRATADELARVIDLDRPVPEASSVLLEVAQTIGTELDARVVLHRLARLAQSALGAERSAILVVDREDPDRLVPAAAASQQPSPDTERMFFSGTPVDLSENDAARRLWLSAAPVAVEHPEDDPIIPEAWRALGSRSIAIATLRSGKTRYGLLVVDYVSGPHRFTRAELSLLDAIALSAGAALRNAHLFGQLNRSMQFGQRLLDCSSALIAGRSLREILDLVIEGFQSLLGVTHCGINLLGADADRFVTLAAHGWTPAVGERLFAEYPSEGVEMVRRVWRRDPRKVIRIPNMQELAQWTHLVPPEMGPGMVLPLNDGERVRGFVVAGRPGRADFTDEEVRLAAAFADQAGLAIREAALREAADGRAKAVSALQRLTDVVVGTTDLRGALGALNRITRADAGFECMGVTFSDRKLCELLDVAKPEDDEAAILRGWRAAGARKAVPIVQGDGGVLVPIRLNGRVGGLLRLRGTVDLGPGALQFLRVLADGIGNVAYKSKLRRTAERRAQALAVAAERERIGRDLQDTVGRRLYEISTAAQRALAEVAGDDGAAGLRRELEGLVLRASDGLLDMRRAVYALGFLHVKSDGLAGSLGALAREFTDATGIETQVRVTTSRARLSDEIEAELYRVAHEALSNVDRHSRATGVVVSLDDEDGVATLIVRDDGVGLDQRMVPDWRSTAHLGLRVAARAIESLGGSFRVSVAEPRGLVIVARVPLDA